MSTSVRTVKASAWVVSGKLFSRLFDLALLLILSRLLTPEDFGLIALAMAPIYIGEAILELPLAQALLRFDRPSKSMYDTAFTLGIIRGIALAIIFAGLAWPLSKYYSEPRLDLVICALAISPIFRGTVSPRLVVFMKNMDFRREFALDVVGKATALIVATTIAVTTNSYWAIAAATITTSVSINVLSYIFAPYRPNLTLSEWKTFADMIGWNSVSQLLSALNWQLDRLLLGRFVSPEVLGRYSLADDFVSIPDRSLVAPLTQPLIASFTLQKTPDQLAKTYTLSLNAIILVMVPILLTLSFLAEPIVYLVLGNKWFEAVPIVKWIALICILSLPIKTLSPLALSLDRTRYFALQMGIEFALKLPTTLVGVYLYGIWGAIIARGASCFVVLIATLFIVKKLIPQTVWGQVLPLLKSVVSMCIMAIALWLTRPVLDLSVAPRKLMLLIDLAFCGSVSGLAYILTVYSVWFLSGKPDGVETAALAYVSRIRNRIKS